MSVDASDSGFNLNAYLHQYEDKNAKLTFAVVRTKKFWRLVDGSPNFGLTDSAWWVRITLTNDSDAAELMMLRQDYPLIDTLDLWEKTFDGFWEVRQTDDRRVFASRDIAHREFIFSLSVPARTRKIYYLRCATSGALNISLSLYRPDALLERVSTEQLAYGIYFGGFLVLVIDNLFIFLAVRDKAFVYYLLYALFYGTYFAAVLPSVDREDGLYLAERLRLAVEKLDFSQSRVGQRWPAMCAPIFFDAHFLHQPGESLVVS